MIAHRMTDWGWILIAAFSGLLVATIPFSTSAVLFGMVLVSIAVLMEPALALVLMLTLAPLKTLIETETAVALPFDIGQLMFGLAVIAWLTHKVGQRKTFLFPRLIPVFFPVLAFWGATTLTLPGAYALGAGVNEWLKWAEILVLVYIVADFAHFRWQWLVFGVVLAGMVQALIGLYEFRGGSGAPHLWILDYRYFRAFGTFGQPNPFGAFMGLILPLALGTMWGYFLALRESWDDLALRWMNSALVALYGSMAAIILLGLLVSWSRGAWMGFGAAALVLLWLAPRRLKHGTLLLMGVGLLGGVLWINGRLPPQLIERITSFSEDFTGFGDMRGTVISDENYAIVERLAHWQSAMEMANNRPWLGVGFGNYEVAYPDFALANWPLALGHAHNYYLNLLAETGIIGLTVYAIMWGLIIHMTWRMLRITHPVERGIVLGLMGVWTHMLVHSLVDKLYVNNIFLHIGVMLGLLAIMQIRTQDKEWSKQPLLNL